MMGYIHDPFAPSSSFGLRCDLPLVHEALQDRHEVEVIGALAVGHAADVAVAVPLVAHAEV